MRTQQHIIDTKAVRLVINSIPEYCVIRELTERDYGIDLMVEIFSEEGENKFGTFYETTGHVCYLQIKGTNKEVEINSDNTVSFSIDKKSLFYVEKFSTPFILIRAYTLKKEGQVYYLWLQRYISQVLDIEKPDWRTSSEESLTIKIPIHNNLSINFEKIKRIAWRIKYIEELVEFHERYTEIMMDFVNLIELHERFQGFDFLIKELKRLSLLKTLLTKNNCCIDKNCILVLISYIEGIRDGINKPAKLEDYPDNYNFELLNDSLMSMRFIEEFVAENEEDTTY